MSKNYRDQFTDLTDEEYEQMVEMGDIPESGYYDQPYDFFDEE